MTMPPPPPPRIAMLENTDNLPPNNYSAGIVLALMRLFQNHIF